MPDPTARSRVGPPRLVGSSFGTGLYPPASPREMPWASGKWGAGRAQQACVCIMHGEEKRGKRGLWTHRSINMVPARGRAINVGKGGKGGRRDGGRKAKKGKG